MYELTAEDRAVIGFMTPLLDESQKRLILGMWALEAGEDGVRIVSEASGVGEDLIRQGIEQVRHGIPHDEQKEGMPEAGASGRAASRTPQALGRAQPLPRHHSDYDVQMRHISMTVDEYLTCGDPILFLEPVKAEMKEHEAGRVPHADPGAVAGAAVLEWWGTMGKERFAGADRIYILFSMKSGFDGPSMHRSLAALANEARLAVEVSLVPPLSIRWIDLEEQLTYTVESGEDVEPVSCLVSLVRSE